MENRVENSHGTEIPEKSRSLDLKTLYKSRSRKGVENKSLKRKVSAEDGDENRGKTKKSKKEASLSSLKNVSTSSKKSLDKVYHSGLSSGSHDPEALKSGSSERLDSSSGLNGVSSLSLNNKVIQIPRRKRGFVGRKKFDGGHAHKLPDESAGKVGVVDQTNQTATLNGDDLGAQAESLKVKRKKGIHDFKENINSELNSAPHAKKEDVPTSHSAVSNGDSSLKKARRNRRKRKDLAPHSKSSEKEAEPLVDGSTEKGHDLQEDDEENLEQNAARMLSSRFDPSCTGFSSNNKASANGLSFLLSSEQDFGSHRSKSISGSESNSVDNSGRVLRPRKQHNEKGHSRKRRHFYEVLFGNLDAYWVLNQRIKVFWPLDQSWYYGLVNDYDKEKKLHHVKYDDRDEEWIDLQNERFKLLLLPSEVPGKTEQKKSKVRNRSPDERKGDMKCRKEKKKRDLTSEDGSRIGSYMDTEPIISWLARSTGRVKSSSCAVKKQKTSGLSLKSVPPLSDEDATLHESLGDGSSRRDKNKKISRHPARSSDDVRQEKSTSQGSTGFKDSKMPIVYFRRRLRKNESELSHTSEDDHASVSKLGSLYDFLGSLDANGPLWSIDDAGLLKLTPPRIEPGRVTFELGLPVHSITNDSFGVEFWLFRAAMLCRYGAVVISWPKIYLEMLFVDNVVGLRFLLFEGCLKQAVAFVFLVLSLFHQPNDQGKSIDFQLPATSIRFKFSCGQHLGKQLVFAFYNFLELKNSKWKYLDSQLMSHCLLTKKLPPSECTYDSIKALQIGRNQSPFMSLCAHSSFVKGTQRRSRQGINFMGGSRESTSVNISHPTSRNDELCRKLPPLALSFAAAPTFFISLHLKLLMENCVANICFGDRDSVEHVENSGSMLAVDWSIVEDFISGGSKITPQKNLKAPPSNATSDGSCAKPDAENAISVCHGARTNSSQHFQNGGLDVSVSSGGTGVLEKTGTDEVVQSKAFQSHHPESDQCSLSPRPLVGRDKSDTDSQSFPNGLSVEIPSFDRYEKPVDKEVQSAQQPTEFSWNMNGSIIPSPNPTAPRSTGHRNRNNSSLGHLSHNWSDGTDLFHNGFGSGPKKPRTQVSYTLPYGGFDFSSKQRNLQKGLPHKRIRRANNEKRSSDASRGSQRNLELLSCEANVLVNGSDRGWRECGAHVVLELFDHNEWKLAVKISGTTKYSYKAHQFLQPGTTNRYTHAMMWKGGKDWNWGLEFPDRSQWALFREMHEECYNRNIRSASVKNIPIPGVRLIEESDDNLTEISFLRSSAKYFRQIETDVEMALDPSRVLYDMDSDDEQWILKFQNSSEVHNCGSTEIEDEMFEKTMDMFEKAAFDQQCDEFTSEEIEELVDGAGVGPMDLILSIYEHWQQKRLRKGMPLIRHLQPPSWERYQQQVKEWEQAMIKTNTTLPNGCHGKPASVEKPPMFAFCLKPRGLEVPNKGSKQRSQRKFSVSGHNGVMLGDHDGFHAFGRRSNGFSFGDERVVYAGHNYDSLEDSPLSQTSPGVFSPRDAANMLMSNDGFERNHLRRIHRSKSKKYGRMVSSVGPQMVSSYSPRVVGNRNEVHRWNAGMPDWSSQRYYQPEVSPRHGMGLLDDSDLDEFRLRDASGAAQHAHKMARLKRDKAQRLFYRADLAIHRAVVSLMTAEAIKTSSEDSSDDEE